MTHRPPVVGIIMGSDSDWPTMKPAADVLGTNAYTNAQMLSHSIQNLALYQFRILDAITAELERTNRTLRQTARRCDDLEAQIVEQEARK